MKNGFTLIELMIMIIIVAILASIVAPNFMGSNSLNEKYVRDCLLEKELEAAECQINADVLYPRSQSQSVESGVPSPTPSR